MTLLLADGPAGFADVSAAYGPYAFGIVSLLLLWRFIVKPQLDASKVDTTAFGEIADTMKATAVINQNIVGRLEAVAAKLEANHA